MPREPWLSIILQVKGCWCYFGTRPNSAAACRCPIYGRIWAPLRTRAAKQVAVTLPYRVHLTETGRPTKRMSTIDRQRRKYIYPKASHTFMPFADKCCRLRLPLKCIFTAPANGNSSSVGGERSSVLSLMTCSSLYSEKWHVKKRVAVSGNHELKTRAE